MIQATDERASIERLYGRMIDLDSHLIIPPDELAAILGPLADEDFLLAHLRRRFSDAGGELVRTTSAEGVWRIKGELNAGGSDPDERVRSLDLMGVSRQLVLPNTEYRELREDTPEALAAASRYNDYAIAWSKATGGRCVAAAQVNTCRLHAALAETERVLAAGARAVLLPCFAPPAGLSPAAPEWEPLWSMLAEARVPAVFHFGSAGVRGPEGLPDPRWSPWNFDRERMAAGEPLGTFRWAMTSLAPQVYLSAMILDGVFERHPQLRFGVIELTARWVGPWARDLDWVVDRFGKRGGRPLSLKPSEYVRRQVRVTPIYGEAVGEYIGQFGMEEVYAFATDFPHVEGGTDPVGRFHASLQPLGEEQVERFFVANGAGLLPP